MADQDPGSATGPVHRPVLLAESLELMDLAPGMTVVDGTVGSAGHAKEFLSRIQPGGFLLGLDRDPQVAELAARELISAGFTRGEQFEVEVRRFSQFVQALADRRISHLDRLFLDIGVCSLHLDRAERGFSFKREGPLDMRMNPQEPGTRSAAEVVNTASESELIWIFETYGEERFSRRIARAVAAAREERGGIRTTRELQEIVAKAIPRAAWPPKTDPATRVFQALRIEVNRELDELKEVLQKLPEVLTSPGARCGIITFHSLEDRLVKRAFAEMSRGCTCPPELPVCACGGKRRFRVISSRPVAAGRDESSENPRARSAKLRGVERLVE